MAIIEPKFVSKQLKFNTEMYAAGKVFGRERSTEISRWHDFLVNTVDISDRPL